MARSISRFINGATATIFKPIGSALKLLSRNVVSGKFSSPSKPSMVLDSVSLDGKLSFKPLPFEGSNYKLADEL